MASALFFLCLLLLFFWSLLPLSLFLLCNVCCLVLVAVAGFLKAHTQKRVLHLAMRLPEEKQETETTTGVTNHQSVFPCVFISCLLSFSDLAVGSATCNHPLLI
jgi:cell division protein FtsW (lipid II flippase)